MTVPRLAVVTIGRRAEADELRARLVDRRVARLLVHDGSPGSIVGHMALRDAPLSSKQAALGLGALTRPVRFELATTRAADLLRDMQSRYGLWPAPAVLWSRPGAAAAPLAVRASPAALSRGGRRGCVYLVARRGASGSLPARAGW